MVPTVETGLMVCNISCIFINEGGFQFSENFSSNHFTKLAFSLSVCKGTSVCSVCPPATSCFNRKCISTTSDKCHCLSFLLNFSMPVYICVTVVFFLCLQSQSWRPEQSVLQALESLTDAQVKHSLWSPASCLPRTRSFTRTRTIAILMSLHFPQASEFN